MSESETTENTAPERSDWMQEGDRIAGGEVQHVALRAWSRSNVPAAELAEMNARVRADPSFYPKMIENLRERQRGGGVTPEGAPFISPKEMHAAMRESTEKHGSWERDPALMQRLNATPKSVRTEL